MTDAFARRPYPPVPSSVSEEAQRFLATPPAQTPRPALDDVEGWLRYVEQRNQMFTEQLVKLQPPVVADETEIAGVHTYVVRARDVRDSADVPIYMDIHGGALVMGDGEVCKLTATLATPYTGMITWAPDYRMPPLHPYPAALDDCVAVYRALLEERLPADIFVGGGSAGGNLATALLVRARDEGLPMPAALVLLTPEVDLTESGDSFHTNFGIDNVLGQSLMEQNLLYAGGHDLAHPYLSPLLADLMGFPPTFLMTGTRDMFLSNTVRMHRKLRAAGVETELHVFEAMPHGGFGGDTPEDREFRMEMRRFLDEHRRSPE